MTELTDLNLHSVLNSPDYRLTTETNFQQIQGAIDLLQSAFGIQFAPNPTVDSQNATFIIDILKSNTIKLPVVGATKISFDGSNGGILGSSINVSKNSYIGGDLFLYNKSGIDGRIKFGIDRVNDEIKTPEVGQIRFTGSSFQGYVVQNEVSSKFSFSIGSTGSGNITISYNGTSLITVAWQGTSHLTANKIVSEIAAISDPTNVSYPAIKASSSINGMDVSISAPGMSISPASGSMLHGINGTTGWVDFNNAPSQAGQVVKGTTSNILATQSPQQGMIRFSTDDLVLAFYDGSNWVKLQTNGNL